MRFLGDAVFSFLKLSFFSGLVFFSANSISLAAPSPTHSLASVVTYSILIGVIVASLLQGAFFILHLVFRSRRPMDQRADHLRKVSQTGRPSEGLAKKKSA